MRNTYFFTIPAGAEPSVCKSCGQRIYWIEHTPKPRRKNDIPVPKPLPISVKHDMAIEPTFTTWGRGISHFADCPNGPQHRKAAPTSAPADAKLELVA